MTIASRKPFKIVAGALAAFASGTGLLAVAHGQTALGNISDKDSIFIDAKTFEILDGKSRGDIAARIKVLGARELDGGVIIARSGDKLYIVDSPEGAQTAAPGGHGQVHIDYEEPKNSAHKEIFELIKQQRALETIRELLSPFRLPEDIYIKTVGCDGTANAYFFRERELPTIRLCYEYLQQVHDRLPKVTTKDGIEPHDAAVGQLLFAIMHEFGHAAFDIYNVPVFGRQEDAADEFATYVILQFGGEKAHRLIKGAAYSYVSFIKDLKDKPKVTLPLAAFSSDHGTPEERFYNLLCIAYGYDAKIFAGVIDKGYLPESRAKVCKYEYSNLRYAFRAMITPHIDLEKARKVIETTSLVEENARASAP